MPDADAPTADGDAPDRDIPPLHLPPPHLPPADLEDVAPLAVDVEGDGPPLVAVHGGLLGGHLSFGGVTATWARHHRVVVVDRPGYGRTGGAGATIDVQAARLLATLAAEVGDTPAHAVGFSVGGLVVLRAVQQRPEAFASLTLVETPAEDLCPSDMVAPAEFGALVRRTHAALDRDPGALGELFAEIDPALWAAVAPRLGAEGSGLTALRTDLEIWTARLDRDALAAAVSGEPPIGVLAVSGSKGSPAGRSFGACTAAALAGRHVVIEGAGHAAHLHPAFAGLLLEHTGAA